MPILLQILNGYTPLQPSTTIISLPRNKTVQVSIPASIPDGTADYVRPFLFPVVFFKLISHHNYSIRSIYMDTLSMSSASREARRTTTITRSGEMLSIPDYTRMGTMLHSNSEQTILDLGISTVTSTGTWKGKPHLFIKINLMRLNIHFSQRNGYCFRWRHERCLEDSSELWVLDIECLFVWYETSWPGSPYSCMEKALPHMDWEEPWHATSIWRWLRLKPFPPNTTLNPNFECIATVACILMFPANREMVLLHTLHISSHWIILLPIIFSFQGDIFNSHVKYYSLLGFFKIFVKVCSTIQSITTL